jgi:ribonuclease HI
MQVKFSELNLDIKGKKEVNQIGHGMPHQAKEPHTAWTKPTEGWYKLNVDAGFSHEENNGSWGAVLRDHEGKVMFSAWGTIAYCQSAEIAEAIAALEGTKAMLPVAARPVILESDSAVVVNELKMKDRSRSPLAFILSETRDMLLLLPDFKIQKVNRTGNSVAHDLASFGRSVWSRGVLVSEIPPCAVESAQKDCNSGCNQDTV